MLRASLTEAYEAQSREKDNDLKMLRREMIEAMTKFASEKQAIEKALDDKEAELTESKVRFWL